MKIELDIDDDLYEKAVVFAEQEGITFDALVERALTLVLAEERPAESPRSSAL